MALLNPNRTMTTIQLNLGNALTVEELQELTAQAQEQRKPLERVLFEAARDLAARRRAQPKPEPKRAA
jgi:hypothetical protein